MSQTILFDPATHAHLIPQLVHIHVTCIMQPTYTIATFLPPLKPDVMLAWWQSRAQEVAAGQRAIIMHVVSDPSSGKVEVAGMVLLAMAGTETVPFRGWVEKLLVLPEYRGKGIARKMMLRLEEVACKEGKKLLILDTEKGSPAELMYPKLGYKRVGEIPGYMISPFDGSLRDGVLFYKDMR